MDEFTQILEEATEKVAREYFYLEIVGGDPVFRERVYCYELYHQMRCLWPPDTHFFLNGELDKYKHPILEKLIPAYKPDLLVHRPGSNERNYAIIEVKSRDGFRDVGKDLKTLSLFVTRVGYKRAILLIYGAEEVQGILEHVKRQAEAIKRTAEIELWVHARAGEAAKQIAVIAGR